MRYVGWIRIDSDPWADVIAGRVEWMTWTALSAIYADAEMAERIVLPEGCHPEGLPCDLWSES